ncbi:MAG: hypothetical protein GY866_14330 [Proteobacteria bacterium]|nr:hypothetical protein [Pseudomonadota bacterium]
MRSEYSVSYNQESVTLIIFIRYKFVFIFFFIYISCTQRLYISLQIHCGYGYMNEYPINRLYRDAKLYEIGAGTSEIRRLVIADELLKR